MSELPLRGGALEVVGVSLGSLAHRLGVRPGDRMVSLNGMPLEHYEPHQLLRNLSDREMRQAQFARNGSVLPIKFR